MIVKVQIALNGPDLPALVYTKWRTHFLHMELPDDIKEALGKDVKGYFEAEFVDGACHIGKRVKEQPW
jgi:hypothetical protein